MKNMKKNRKGFTLVELLAVIVVLAVIMIFAVPTVLNTMNAAREASFKNYALKVLAQAQATYQAESITNRYSGTTLAHANIRVTQPHPGNRFAVQTKWAASFPDTPPTSTPTTPIVATPGKAFCYTLEQLGMKSTGTYKGYVVIAISTTHQVEYFVSLTDGRVGITDETSVRLNSEDALTFDTTTRPNKCCPGVTCTGNPVETNAALTSSTPLPRTDRN